MLIKLQNQRLDQKLELVEEDLLETGSDFSTLTK